MGKQFDPDLIYIAKKMVCHLHHEEMVLAVWWIVIQIDQLCHLYQTCCQGLSHVKKYVLVQNFVYIPYSSFPILLATIDHQDTG